MTTFNMKKLEALPTYFMGSACKLHHIAWLRLLHFLSIPILIYWRYMSNICPFLFPRDRLYNILICIYYATINTLVCKTNVVVMAVVPAKRCNVTAKQVERISITSKERCMRWKNEKMGTTTSNTLTRPPRKEYKKTVMKRAAKGKSSKQWWLKEMTMNIESLSFPHGHHTATTTQ